MQSRRQRPRDRKGGSVLSALTIEEARALVRRAAMDDLPRRRPKGFRSARRAQRMYAMLAGAWAAVLHQDVEVLADLAAGIQQLQDYWGHEARQVAALGSALSDLVDVAGAESSLVQRLATHSCESVRLAVAQGIRPEAATVATKPSPARGTRKNEREAAEPPKAPSRHPSESRVSDAERVAADALLLELAKDVSPSVRSAARKRLPAEGLHEWFGIFSEDPLPKVVEAFRLRNKNDTAKAESRATELLKRVYATYAKTPRERASVEPALIKACAELPDDVFVDLARHAGTTFDVLSEPSALLRSGATRAGGDALIVSVFRQWVAYGMDYARTHLTKSFKDPSPALDEARRRIGCLAAKEAGDTRVPAKERSELVELAAEWLDPDRLEVVAELLAALLDEGNTELLEAFSKCMAYRLDKCPRIPAPMMEWAIAELESGRAFGTSARGRLVAVLVSKAPTDRQRDLASRFLPPKDLEPSQAKPAKAKRTEGMALTNTPDPRRAWALSTLFESGDWSLEDERRFGPKPDSIAELFANPEVRSSFFAEPSLVRIALPHARRALRRGELGFKEAQSVFRAVNAVFDPTAPSARFMPIPDEERATLDALLGEAELRGPFTSEEMAAYLRVRATHDFTEEGIERVDLVLLGSDSVAGKALLEVLLDLLRAKDARAARILQRVLYETADRTIVEGIRSTGLEPGWGAAFDDLKLALEDTEVELGLAEAKRVFSDSALPGSRADADLIYLPIPDARRLLDAGLDDPTTYTSGWAALESHHRHSLVQLGAACLTLHGDVSALEAIAYAIECGFGGDDGYTLLDHLGVLVALQESSSASVKALAKSPNAAVREKLAESLRPSEPAARALLVRLAGDTVADVRNAAKSALGESSVPWWLGIFTRDPSETLSDEDAHALAPTFRNILAELGPDADARKAGSATQTKRLVGLSEALPAALAVDLARQQGGTYRGFGPLPPLVASALRREGGDELLVELLRVWTADGPLYTPPLVEWLAGGPKAMRAAMAMSVLRMCLEPDLEERVNVLQVVSGLLLPAQADEVAEVLLPIEGEDAEQFGELCHGLAEWFEARRSPPGALVAWALERMQREAPEAPWESSLAKAMVKRAPREERRAVAMAALSLESPSRVRWALGEILGPCHDSKRDGTRAAHVKALFSDPRLRRHFLAETGLLNLALPLAREELRARRLDFVEALRVAKAVQSRYDESVSLEDDTKHAAKGSTPRGKRNAKRSGTPRSGPTPLTEAEREAYIDIRASYRFEGLGWGHVDFDIIGDDTDIARAHLRNMLQAAREGEVEAAEGLGRALFVGATEKLLEVGWEMQKHYADTGTPRLLRYGLEKAHKALDLPPPPPILEMEDD